jgi:hypothetical protein
LNRLLQGLGFYGGRFPGRWRWAGIEARLCIG